MIYQIRYRIRYKIRFKIRYEIKYKIRYQIRYKIRYNIRYKIRNMKSDRSGISASDRWGMDGIWGNGRGRPLAKKIIKYIQNL